MGSSDGGAGREERWWENPKLSPADLRQHAETWSLADDSAMATLLQSISQRLVSRTHEVEEALERVLEDTDRIVTNIANTNNAFHMLANTQFIENRTYQDDADVAREKQETIEKPPVTEEDILSRCRTAIEDGLSLVTRSYERHEIQDSDSDDDDTPGSPVPVYALIDPYESKPLPLIIGTEGFLTDDKVGLELSSSEENSRMTFSPDDTESEGELEDETDRVTLQQRTIPASSSRVLDDDSDSEWSGEDGPMLDKINAAVKKEKQLRPPSDVDDDDEDDDMFVPSRNTKVGNIFSPAQNAGTNTPITDANRKTGVDTDSEDEGLFGKEQRSSSLFNKTKQPSKPLEYSKPSTTSSNPLGVENVRAMPDATPTKVSDPVKPKQIGGNLFGSDSDDGDLFSTKPSHSENISKTPRQNQGETQGTSSGGLFSSDEESPLFSGLPSTQESRKTKEENEEPPSVVKESGRKVPVGGVSIFGSAITSALKRPQSSDEESSDSDDFKEPDANSNKDPTPPPPKPIAAIKRSKDSTPAPPKPDINTKSSKDSTPTPSKQDNRSPQKTSNAVKLPEKGGLFDSDDEDNLFDTLVKKPISVGKHAEETQNSSQPSPPESSLPKPREENLLVSNSHNLSWKSSNTKPTAGLFSDDDDDLFGIPPSTKKSDAPVPETEPTATKESPPKIVPAPAKTEEPPASKPATLFTSPPDYPPASDPVNISKPPKTSHSLFSSSDEDDDDLFSTIPKPVEKTNTASAFMREPPPLPPQSSAKEEESVNKGSTHPNVTLSSNSIKDAKVNIEETPKETSSLFGSPSDDDDIFSPLSISKNSEVIPPLPSKEEIEPTMEPHLDQKAAATGNSNNTDHLGKEATEGISVFPEEHPHNDSDQNEKVDQNNKLSEPTNLFAEGNKDTDIVHKEDDIFNSVDDKLFDESETLSKSSNVIAKEEDSTSVLTPDTQFYANSETSPVSSDTASSALPKPLKEDSSKLNKSTSDPPSVEPPERESDVLKKEKPKEGAAKPPVGGVALFGGKELNTQLNKQKNLLKTAKNRRETDDIFSDENEDDQSKDHIFDDSTDIFGISGSDSKSQHNHSVLHRQSPPLLPEEIENISRSENDLVSTKQNPPETQEETHQRIAVQSDDGPDKSPDTTSDLPSLPDNAENCEPKEEKEISPRRKPPVGGISMFGGSAMGNNELFAKVLQRKSMLAYESDSSEEDSPTEARDATKPSAIPAKPSVLPTVKGATLPKSAVNVNAASSHSIYPPVFSSNAKESKSGGDEGGVSFDDPATQSNVLQSLNKTRARGSLKRRPPSRAHRKKADDDLDPTKTPQTSLSAAVPSNNEHHTMPADTSKREPSQVAERLQDPLAEKDQKKVPVSAEQKEKDIFTPDIKTDITCESSESVVGSLQPDGASPDKKIEKVTFIESKDVLDTPGSALNLSKAKSDSRVKSQSVFDVSDSDEDLFGETKPKEGARNPLSSASKKTSKVTGTKSKSHSLFEDDDDDNANIFSSKTQVAKTSTGASKSTSITKPKQNLKHSSEPFEDPLLGNLKE